MTLRSGGFALRGTYAPGGRLYSLLGILVATGDVDTPDDARTGTRTGRSLTASTGSCFEGVNISMP
jgi:hypothetical protein